MMGAGLVNIGIPLEDWLGTLIILGGLTLLILSVTAFRSPFFLMSKRERRALTGDHKYSKYAWVWVATAVIVTLIICLRNDVSVINTISYSVASLAISVGFINLVKCKNLKAQLGKT